MNCSSISRKLPVTIVPPATQYRPLDNRQYRLIYKENADQYHLYIGKNSENESLHKESVVLAGEWRYHQGHYILVLTANQDQIEASELYSKKHGPSSLVKKNLDHLISAMIQGDFSLYKYFPWLLDTGIYLQLDHQEVPQNETLYIGKPRKFIQKQRETMIIS